MQHDKPDLFSAAAARDQRGRPLAERLRPRSLGEIIGQDHLLGLDGVLTKMTRQAILPSCILWGPPGTGKTTLAKLLADAIKAQWATLLAVHAGVKDLREVLAEAKRQRAHYGRKTLLFIDELHRFNRAQQDALLPAVEEGQIIFVGATTENPGVTVNRALLSRCRLFTLQPLSSENIAKIMARGLALLSQEIAHIDADEALLKRITHYACGDARRALGLIETTAHMAWAAGASTIVLDHLDQSHQSQVLAHDRLGDNHFDLTSALIKSLRHSDPKAAMYYLARLVEAGEDASFIARRLLIFASEDIGNACPHAFLMTTATAQAVASLGMPEAKLSLSQAVLYLAEAPKGREVANAYAAAAAAVEACGAVSPPAHLLNRSVLPDSPVKTSVRPINNLPKGVAAIEWTRPS